MNFIRLQFGGLSPFFYLGLGFAAYSAALSTIYFGGDIFATLTRVLGIIYIFFVGAKRAIGFVFGLIWCFTYMQYGNDILVITYIPINLFGIYTWIKIQKSRNGEVEIRNLSGNSFTLWLLASLVSSAIYGFFIHSLDSFMGFLAAFTIMGQIFAFYLQAQRYRQNYLLFTIVNSTYFGMWIYSSLSGHINFMPLFMIIATLILGIFFYFYWAKEPRDKEIL